MAAKKARKTSQAAANRVPIYAGAPRRAVMRVVELYKQWRVAAQPQERLKLAFLRRPLSITASEDREIATAGRDLPPRLSVDLYVRLILWSEVLSVDPHAADWLQRTWDGVAMRTLRGNTGWFERRKSPGPPTPLEDDVRQEAARLLAAAGRARGDRQRALHPLLERLGIPPDQRAAATSRLARSVRRLVEKLRERR